MLMALPPDFTVGTYDPVHINTLVSENKATEWLNKVHWETSVEDRPGKMQEIRPPALPSHLRDFYQEKWTEPRPNKVKETQ